MCCGGSGDRRWTTHHLLPPASCAPPAPRPIGQSGLGGMPFFHANDSLFDRLVFLGVVVLLAVTLLRRALPLWLWCHCAVAALVPPCAGSFMSYSRFCVTGIFPLLWTITLRVPAEAATTNEARASGFTQTQQRDAADSRGGSGAQADRGNADADADNTVGVGGTAASCTKASGEGSDVQRGRPRGQPSPMIVLPIGLLGAVCCGLLSLQAALVKRFLLHRWAG